MRKMLLTEAASVIRSKNAGPYELTLDIMFRDEEVYGCLKKMDFFNTELFAALYQVPVENILKVAYFDPAFAVKCTMKRAVVSGSRGDSDVYGAQQHAPLLSLEVPAGE